MAPEVQAATEAYRDEQDRLKGFLDDRCEIGQYFEVGVGSLYVDYEAWASSAGVELIKKTAFGKAMRSKGLEQKQRGHEKTRCWVGIRLRTEADTISVKPLVSRKS